jgi:serine/threonine protein kinase
VCNRRQPTNLTQLSRKWCRGRESNPHAPCGTQDFKSCASASSATPACDKRSYRINDLRGLRLGISACSTAIVPAFCPFQHRGCWSHLPLVTCSAAATRVVKRHRRDQTRHKLSIRDRIDLFVRVCESVHHARQKGIIHRNLKPSNILVTLQNDRPVPKIIDFGVAKAMTHSLTSAPCTPSSAHSSAHGST